MENIADELFNRILKYVKKIHLKKLVQLSKKYYLLFRKILWKEVEFIPPNKILKKYGYFIEIIKLNGIGNFDYKILIDLCKNIKYINFGLKLMHQIFGFGGLFQKYSLLLNKSIYIIRKNQYIIKGLIFQNSEE